MAIIKVMNSNEFIEKAVEIALNYKTVYANGMYGFPLDANAVSRAASNSASAWWYTEERKEKLKTLYSRGYFGFDCVCFIKAILWGWNGNRNHNNGGATYGSNSVEDNTENYMIENICYDVSTDFTKILPGEFLWISGHCGIYIGDGLAVECTSRWDNGVQITAVANIGSKVGYCETTWTKHGRLPYIQYNDAGHIILDKFKYLPGEKINIITYELNGDFNTGYVELRRTSLPDYLGTWCYIGTGTHELPTNGMDKDERRFTLNAVSNQSGTPQNLAPGNYKAVLYNSKGIVFREVPFEVFDPAAASIVEARYANNWIDVSVKGKLSDTAWVGIYPNNQTVFNDSEENASKAWHYTNDIPVRICMNADNRYYATRIRIEKKDALINPESYKAVLFYNSGYSKADQKNLEILPLHPNDCIPSIKQITSTLSARLYVNSGSYKVGQAMKITFYGADNIDAWIGLYKKGDAYNPNKLGMWCYTSSGKQWLGNAAVKNGIVELSANERDRYTGTKRFTPAGNYELVLFGNSGYTNVLAKADVTIIS